MDQALPDWKIPVASYIVNSMATNNMLTLIDIGSYTHIMSKFILLIITRCS